MDCGFIGLVLNMSHLEQYFVDPQNVSTHTFSLQKEEFWHAARVRRKRTGEWITAVDGMGNRYAGPIITMDNDHLVVEIKERTKMEGEPRLQLTLAQAIIKGSSFDWIIEKGTEIGISCFQPLITSRSISLPSSRLDRWRQKARAAAKQSGRSVCPKVFTPVLFRDFVKHAQGELFIAHEAYKNAHGAQVKLERKAVYLVGPEGGFSDEEFKLALQHHAVPLSLGSRRLRSETAGLIGSALLLAKAGDLGMLLFNSLTEERRCHK